MTRVVMLLSNAFRPDPRVAKEAEGLAEAGYDVEIICWDREGRFPPKETVDGYMINRIQDVKTAYGAGLRQILYTPRYWNAALRRIRCSATCSS